MAVFADLSNIYCDRHNYGKMAVLAIIERIIESILFFRTLILDQFSYIYIKIPTQFAYQSSIKTADTISTVFIEVGSGNIKVFTNLVLADTRFF